MHHCEPRIARLPVETDRRLDPGCGAPPAALRSSGMTTNMPPPLPAAARSLAPSGGVALDLPDGQARYWPAAFPAGKTGYPNY